MADEDWPSDLCSIQREGYTQQIAPDVRRTQFEDGSVLQKRTQSRPLLLRRFNLLVADENLVSLFNWFQSHSHAYFNFVDLDGTERECRLRGGVGAIEFTAAAGDRLSDGGRYHTAPIELEGYLD